MKRLLLAALILAAGASVFCALENSTARLRKECTARREEWMAQTQSLEQARIQHSEWTVHVRELKQGALSQPPAGARSELAALIPTNRAHALSPEQRERLLAELGFDWHAMADFLVVSKDTLRKVGVEAMRGVKMTETACNVLAITPEERARVEASAERLAAEFQAWALAHVQRAEPEGNVLARYTLPPDSEFSQSLSNAFSGGVMEALGQERGELLLGYAQSWMADLAMRGGSSTMTIKRYGPDMERLGLELKTPDGGTMFTDISPHQRFPEGFRSIFPGGWVELAQREGFRLPKEFQQKDGSAP